MLPFFVAFYFVNIFNIFLFLISLIFVPISIIYYFVVWMFGECLISKKSNLIDRARIMRDSVFVFFFLNHFFSSLVCEREVKWCDQHTLLLSQARSWINIIFSVRKSLVRLRFSSQCSHVYLFFFCIGLSSLHITTTINCKGICFFLFLRYVFYVTHFCLFIRWCSSCVRLSSCHKKKKKKII